MLNRAAKLIFIGFILWIPNATASIAISSARVWPAQDYTRLTLESKQAIHYKLLTLKNPERLVIDLDDVETSTTLSELSNKIGSDDPYIKSVRVGRFKPGVVRLVLDLKTEAKPQLFNLKPVAEYGHRLVLDVYPAVAVDPLMALAQQSENKTAADLTKQGLLAASSVAASTVTAAASAEPKPQILT